jgi:hypothetical protein
VARGTALTPSKASKGAYRGLVHGSKGVAKQAEFFKVDRKGSFFGTLLAFLGKCLAAVVAVGAVVALAAVLIGAIADGVSAGLAQVAEAISTASSFLIVGASIAAALAVVVGTFKITRAVGRSRARARERAARADERRQAIAEAAAHQARQVQAPYITNASAAARGVASTHLHATPADWYPDPSNPSQIRYWNGYVWTEHVRHTHAVATTPAGWFPDPSDTTRLRYWDGTRWTEHFAPKSTTAVPAQSTASYESANSRISMSSTEWQNAVRAWMAAGAVEQELWRRISNAQISDGDQRTLEVQRRMEQLTREQGAQQVRLMLEANPGLRDELAVSDLVTFLLRSVVPLDQNTRVGIGRKDDGNAHGRPNGLV